MIFFFRSHMGPSALCGPQLFSWVHGLPSSSTVHTLPSALGTHRPLYLTYPFSSALIQRSFSKDGGNYFLCAILFQDNPSILSNSSCVRCFINQNPERLVGCHRNRKMFSHHVFIYCSYFFLLDNSEIGKVGLCHP